MGNPSGFLFVDDDVNHLVSYWWTMTSTYRSLRGGNQIKAAAGGDGLQTVRDKMAESSHKPITFDQALQREHTRQKRHCQGGKYQELSQRLEQHEEIPLVQPKRKKIPAKETLLKDSPVLNTLGPAPVHPPPPRRWPRRCCPCDLHLPLIAHRLIFPPRLRNCWARCPSVRKCRHWKRPSPWSKKRKKKALTRLDGISHRLHPTGMTPCLKRGCPMQCYLDEIPSTSMTTTRRFPHRTSVYFTSCLYPATSRNKVGPMSSVPYNRVRSSWTKRRHPEISPTDRRPGHRPRSQTRRSCVFVMNLWLCVFPGPPRTQDVCF